MSTITKIEKTTKQIIQEKFIAYSDNLHQYNMKAWEKAFDSVKENYPEILQEEWFIKLFEDAKPVGNITKKFYSDTMLMQKNKIYQLEQQLEAKDQIITNYYQRIEDLDRILKDKGF